MKKITKVLALAIFSLTACVEENVQITALYLDTMELYLDVGTSRRLVATARPADAPVTFKWFSSDEKVATVTQDGLVTLVSDGTTTVTVMWGSYRRSCVVTTAGLKLTRNKVYISPGGTTQLKAEMKPEDGDALYTWESSDPDIVTVDKNGLATYKQSGSAEISVSYGKYTSICKVYCLENSPLDFRSVLGQGLSESLLYSKNVSIASTGRIMQGFDIVDGVIYYSQVSNDGKSVLISRAEGPGKNTTATMTLNYFGHGTQIAVESTSDGDYIWAGSNGTELDEEYGDNLSFSRVKFEGGKTHDSCAGDTYVLTGTGEYDLQVSLDFDNRKLLLGTRKGGQRHFAIYNLDEVLNLPVKDDVPIYTQVEGEEKETKLKARDLSDCEPISRFSVSAGADKDNDVYSYSHQGHAVDGDYIYFYEGNVIDDGKGAYYSKAYLTTFNYSGDIVVDRTEVKAIADNAKLKTLGLTTVGYAEAESLKIKDNTLYLGIACHDGGNAKRYANILKYKLQ